MDGLIGTVLFVVAVSALVWLVIRVARQLMSRSPTPSVGEPPVRVQPPVSTQPTAGGFCPKCGNQRVGAFRFCRSCGFDFEAQATGASPMAPAATNTEASQAGWTKPKPMAPLQRWLIYGVIGVSGLVFIGMIGDALTGGRSAAPAASGSVGVVATPTRPPTRPPTSAPTERSTPELSASGWSVGVDAVRYTTDAFVGGTITIEADLFNIGSIDSPGTRISLDGIDDRADAIGCDPDCEITDFFGLYVDLPGVPGEGDASYEIELLATSIGVIDWFICVYDENGAGNQVWCGDGTTVIR